MTEQKLQLFEDFAGTGNLTLSNAGLKGELTIQKIYKAEYSFFYKEQECQSTMEYFQKKEDAEEFIEEQERLYKNDEKNLEDKREYRIEEIEVK